MQLANFGHPFQRLSAAAEPDRAEPSWRGGFHALGAAARKRRHNGVRHSLVGGLPDPVLEQLLDAMVFYRLLSEGETMDQTRVRSRTQRPRSSPTGVVVGALAHARPDGPKSVKGACAPVGFQIQESWT